MNAKSNLKSGKVQSIAAAISMLTLLLLVSPPPGASAQAPTVDAFINEIHYDNEGADTGEAIEVAGPAGTDLTGWSLVLYNGNGGALYGTVNLSGEIPDQQGGCGTLSFPRSGIQNGAPDGIALVDDADNVVLATATAFTALDIIPAGGTSPFAVLFAQPPTAYATYQVIPLSAEPSTYLGSRYRDLDVVEHEGQTQGRLFIVSGRVRNVGEERATGVEVVITAYDSQDRVVAMREVEVQVSVLAPGASAAFTASISPMGDEIARYTVQVQGRRIVLSNRNS